MKTITLKLDKNTLQNVDQSLQKHNFSTRTEFIRDAIREKLKDLSREDLIKKFLNFKGKAKKKTTDEENRKTREQVSKELMAELEKRFT